MGNWNGTGTYVRSYNWETDKANGVPITASRMQPDTQDMADNGFGNCLTRDGQGIATADLPMGTFKHLNVGAAAARNEYAQVGQVQDTTYSFAVGAGTGDAITADLSPAITAYANGMIVHIRAPGANTVTNPTIALNGIAGAKTITKNNGNALAIGEYATGQDLILSYDSTGPHFDLLNLTQTTTGNIPNNTVLGNVSGSAASAVALTDSQLASMLGGVGFAPLPINSKMFVSTAGNTGTFTAQAAFATPGIGQIVYGTASYSKAIDLSTTGAGGMDTGSAPVSGYVSLYAIYNPTTSTWSILACADSTSSGLLYSGANMPSGYTASGLLGIWPTDSSRHFVTGLIRGRQFYYNNEQSSTPSITGGTVAITIPVPIAAVSCSGKIQPSVTSKGVSASLYSDATILAGLQTFQAAYEATSLTATATFTNLPISTAQTIYGSLNGGVTATHNVYICSYGF